MTPEHVRINPTEEGDASRLPIPRVQEPLTITIFGATGDLTHRKLLPALFAMHTQGLLPQDFSVVAFARREYDDDSYRAWMGESIREFSRVDVPRRELDRFLDNLYYHRGDLGDATAYAGLRERLTADAGLPDNHLFYLSVAPRYFEEVIGQLHGAGLIRPHHETPWTRVVVEKPFGHDLASAMTLNHSVRKYLDESQIYRIDHYLGKETVQNILSFRFANAIFEPLFNQKYVERIQITAAETVGMEKGRGAYFDSTGTLRDMVQNHLLQLLCLVAMEPPANMTADAIRNEKVKVLQSLRPLQPATVGESVLRGQYVSGKVGDDTVCGYLEEDRVDPNSRTETYAGLRVCVGNWRWAGVPMYLRTGKRLRARDTEIRVEFKRPPLELFQTVECVGDVCDLTHARPNVLVFQIQPNEGISLRFSAKRPALQVQVESVNMNFAYGQTWEQALPEAYERLLHDVMRGDSTLFTRSDEVEAAWGFVDPILQAWSDPNLETPLYRYNAGSWGPGESARLFKGTEHTWMDP